MDDVYVRAPAHTRFPTIHAALFLATVATTLWTGFELAGGQAPAWTGSLLQLVEGVAAGARAGAPFAGALVAILLSHEMGHYLLARRHRVDATLPFFIPFLPFPFGVGTLGAVIRIRSRMPSRAAVLDIGLAGPVVGFVVAVPLLLWGYAHSQASPLSTASLPLPSVLNLVRGILRHETLPEGSAIFFGRSLVSMLALRLVHPELPFGSEVVEHPVAIAAWFGLYVTTINLLPIGQLDGGHALYALLGGERARRVSRLFSWVLLGLGVFVSWTWIAWWRSWGSSCWR
jgi:membrane-associated protease RseP (regulator of RpoE activity)